ncbi:hypothetical protein Cgig2_003097 [Carnegiea gigantea]|uniref:WAT1-related protein n=1 Tax=Carnegiea gigantea TaxID=171969 RepID=A0A9Q1GR94_9CARY|nr:hypothetical protein Cgig2_003097 [Carnegiea gigantea]
MGNQSLCEMVAKAKSYLAIISLQFGYSGMYIVTAVCLKHGMNHFILSVYRHVFATLVIVPFALVFERPVLDQNMYYVGLKNTSATFASASVNVLPAITFILATIFRLEKVDIRKLSSQAKIIGTIVTVSGAMVMTIYRGPVVNLFGVHGANHHGTTTTAAASAEGGVLSLIFVRDLKAWALGWDSRLLASAYSGVVCSGIAYYVQGVVNRERGPVFVTVFSPLCMIITAALGALILHELLHLGSIIGAVIIVAGLYTVVWGKSKDMITSSSTNKMPTIEKGQELPIVNDISTHNNKKSSKEIIDTPNHSANHGFPSGVSTIKIPPSQLDASV